MSYPIEVAYQLDLTRRWLMDYGVHKAHCATQKNTGHACTCGLYSAIARAHGHYINAVPTDDAHE